MSSLFPLNLPLPENPPRLPEEPPLLKLELLPERDPDLWLFLENVLVCINCFGFFRYVLAISLPHTLPVW